MTVEGVDVSRHQRPESCAWAQAAAGFAFVKISEGRQDKSPYEDPAAASHLKRLRQSPTLHGGYHFARPDRRFAEDGDGYHNGALEAQWAADVAIRLGVGLCPGTLPLALDLERYTERGKVTTEQRDDFVRGFVDVVEDELGRPPIIYTGAGFWGWQHSPELAVELHERGVLLWLVNYTRRPAPTKTIAGWPQSIWQWSGGGDYAHAGPWPGLPHPIDRNVFYGSFEQLRALAR